MPTEKERKRPNKLSLILDGWKNYTFPSKHIEEKAMERAKICASCKHANPDHPFKVLTLPEKEITEIKGMGCDLCSCPLSTKLRALLEQCPQYKW